VKRKEGEGGGIFWWIEVQGGSIFRGDVGMGLQEN
jgi:hypothetical protein